MADFVDIMIAKALTPQGQIDTYAARAQEAVINAQAAVDNINLITEQTNTNNELAETNLSKSETALENAEQTLAGYQSIVNSLEETIASSVNEELNKLQITSINANTQVYNQKNLKIKYPNNSEGIIQNMSKYYLAKGQNTDGSMTQKIITDELNKLENKINNIPNSNNTSINLGSENAGKLITVASSGEIVSSIINEDDIINILLQSNIYNAKNAVGIEIDYSNKSYSRIQEAKTKTPGNDFNKYLMYGGRMRCNVANDGTIIAWLGDINYKEDGTNGQVMIYQPKFYYKRIPLITEEFNAGKIIRKEQIIISYDKQTGLKLHPMFINENNEELDYVLISAYEGCAYNLTNGYDLLDSSSVDLENDMLSSISGAKPISGVNKAFTITAAETMAQNRGPGWHITNLAAESVNQILGAIEYGTLNGQSALGQGIVSIPTNSSYNCSSITGSTSTLGNASGSASITRNEINGVYTDYSTNGKVAISYRGYENPWGNIWRMIGGLNIIGNSYNRGGIPNICSNFNYSNNNNYSYINFTLPQVQDWISAFGYDENFDWVFLPIECSGANSALPVGDNLWITANLNGTNMGLIGGPWAYTESCGPFYMAFDYGIGQYTRAQSARLMYIPEKNTIYNSNYQQWKNKMGVD